jgi:hypothetical protein
MFLDLELIKNYFNLFRGGKQMKSTKPATPAQKSSTGPANAGNAAHTTGAKHPTSKK